MAQIKYFDETDLLYLVNLLYTEFNKYYKLKSDDTNKGLSQENFTTTLKNKLDGIDLTQYSTTAQMNNAIAEAIGTVSGLKFQKVDQLPTTGAKGIIYLVPKTKTGTNDNYDEYYWDADNNKFEYMGSTAIDLTDYLKATDLVELTQAEVKAVWDSVFTS